MNTNSIPKQIRLGPDSLNELPALLKQNGHKVLLVHGHRPVEDGLLVKVRRVLNEAGFEHANMGQILPNPKYGSVKRGIKTARKEHCDIILALGGGSTLQCAKAIALGLGYKGDVWDFWTGKKKPKKVYPVASVLTNPASATELSGGCTIVKDGEQKTIHLKQLICTFAILDPNLSMYPEYPTMNQIFGIFEHLFLAYLEKEGDPQQAAAALLKNLYSCSEALAANIKDVEARTELYRIGVLTHTEVGGVTSKFESLANNLSFACSLPEGSAGSALFASWCKTLSDTEKEKVGQLGQSVFGFDQPSYKKTMKQFQQWFEKMNLPQNLAEAGLTVSDKTLNAIAKNKQQKKVLDDANKKPDTDQKQTGK